MLHLADVSFPSHEPQGGAIGSRAIHRIAFATVARHRHFADAVVATRAAQCLRALPDCPHSRVLAWVLLPDRWIGVIETASADALARRVGQLRAALAPGARGDTRAEPTWATPLHARLVRNDAELAEAAREILDEPVRCGLATRRGEYAFWDAVWHPHDGATQADRQGRPAGSVTTAGQIPAASSNCRRAAAS